MVVEPLNGRVHRETGPWQLTKLSPQTAETDRNPGPPSRCAGVVRQTLRKRFQPAEGGRRSIKKIGDGEGERR